MASAAPPGQLKVRLNKVDGEQLVAQLHPWRRRLILKQALIWTGRGVIVGFILALLVLFIARLVPWASAQYVAFGIGAASAALAFGAALWFRPSLARTTRLIDIMLSLHDRLSTAWEMRNEKAPLFGLQRRDALKQLGQYAPRTAISLRPSRSSLFISGAVLALLVLVILLPNPMTAVLQQQAAFHARVAKQIAAIEHVRSVTLQQANMTTTERAQIDQILRDLQAKLQNAKNETQAQQAIAKAQAQLNRLRDPQASNKAQAQQAVSSALQSSHNANLSAIGQALAKNDSKGLADALKKLAAQVSKMTPTQRAQLAQQLEQAANQAQQDPNLSAALHQLARSAASGSSSDIADASNAVRQAAAQDAATQAQNNNIDQISQSLQQSANAFTSATDGTNSQNQGQGQGQQQTQGQQPGQGSNSGLGNGNNTSNKTGKNEPITVPGKIGSGTSTVSNDGSSGVVQNGSSVPYSQVIQQYSQMAHDAIDNSTISPTLKDLVHSYFNALEGK
jgi:hypothetical protein